MEANMRCAILLIEMLKLLLPFFLISGVFCEDDKYLPIVNRTLQTFLLSLILLIAWSLNISVIRNITKDKLKTRISHFILIRHVCITDFLGASFILPLPLIAVAKGTWDFSPLTCSLVSTSTASLWTMHLIAVAVYRADRLMAVWLPSGRYPVVKPPQINVILVTIWLVVIATCSSATAIFGPTYQPALAICIPNVPMAFFIVVFSSYCSGLVILSSGYLFFCWRRRRKRRSHLYSISNHNSLSLNDLTTPPPSKYFKRPIPTKRTGASAKRAMASYSVSLGHLLLYLPAMLVVGLVKEKLPPAIALFCGLIVYCEFIVQPLALFCLSPKLRKEVFY